MIKQLNNKATYKIEHDGVIYFITLSRLKNTYDGNPRFEALITSIYPDINSQYNVTFNYHFRGHYYDEIDEARYILKYHIEKRAVDYD